MKEANDNFLTYFFRTTVNYEYTSLIQILFKIYIFFKLFDLKNAQLKQF